MAYASLKDVPGALCIGCKDIGFPSINRRWNRSAVDDMCTASKRSLNAVEMRQVHLDVDIPVNVCCYDCCT